MSVTDTLWACEQDVAEINHVRNLANATDISNCAERAKNLRANEWCFSFFGGLILILHVTLDQKAAQRGEKNPRKFLSDDGTKKSSIL